MTKMTKTPTLHDSDTTDRVSAADLGLTRTEYAAAVVSSMNLNGEGHIRVFGTKCGPKGRRVYAA